METRLKEWREAQRYTMDELAKVSGVSKMTIYKIENKKCAPTMTTLTKLAKALKIKTKQLLS